MCPSFLACWMTSMKRYVQKLGDSWSLFLAILKTMQII